MAALAFVKQLADEQLKAFANGTPTVTTEEEKALLESAGGRVTLFDFGAPLSFGAAADLGLQIRQRTAEKTNAIVLDFTRVSFLDVSAARAIETVVCDARQAGQVVYVTGMKESVRGVLEALGADHCLPADTSFDERTDAIRAAVELVISGKGPGGSGNASPDNPVLATDS